MGDAASGDFGDKDPSVFPADYGDAQWFRTFVHDDIARLLQVWPGGWKECEGVSRRFRGKEKSEETPRWCNSLELKLQENNTGLSVKHDQKPPRPDHLCCRRFYAWFNGRSRTGWDCGGGGNCAASEKQTQVKSLHRKEICTNCVRSAGSWLRTAGQSILGWGEREEGISTDR